MNMPKKPAHEKRPVVWTVAGSDPGGSAGFQADIKTLHALGAYPCTVITALLAQNTRGVTRVRPVSRDMLRAQFEALWTEFPPRAVKTGMLARGVLVRETARALRNFGGSVVCDPVLSASSGASLLDAGGVRALRAYLLPLVGLLTPNRPEAEILAGQPVRSDREVEAAAAALMRAGADAVLIKGGHARGGSCRDYFSDGRQAAWIGSSRCRRERRGTGCTLSAAAAAAAAQGLSWWDAVVLAKAYINQGFRLAPRRVAGAGPLEHGGWPCDPRDRPTGCLKPIR